MLWAYNTDDINRGIVQTEMCFPPCADGCRVMWTYSAPTADTPSSSCLGPPPNPDTTQTAGSHYNLGTAAKPIHSGGLGCKTNVPRNKVFDESIPAAQ